MLKLPPPLGLRPLGNKDDARVRKTPSWPRSRANSRLYSCIPAGMHGPTCIFWANLTPFSLAAQHPAEAPAADRLRRDAQRDLHHLRPQARSSPPPVARRRPCSIALPIQPQCNFRIPRDSAAKASAARSAKAGQIQFHETLIALSKWGGINRNEVVPLPDGTQRELQMKQIKTVNAKRPSALIDIKEIKEVFNLLDVDGSGTLDRKEVKQVAKLLGRRLRGKCVLFLFCPRRSLLPHRWSLSFVCLPLL
jgi:hypothetical protein